MGILQGVKLFRGLYECFLRTLRTPLNSPYTLYTPNTPNELNELNTSNLSGFPISLKKLILTRCNAWRGKQIEQIRTAQIAQGVIRVERSGYSEWIEWIERVEPLRVLYEQDEQNRRTRWTAHTQETDSIDETLKGVNTFNMLKGVLGGRMSSTQQHRRDTDRHTQTHEIDARDRRTR